MLAQAQRALLDRKLHNMPVDRSVAASALAPYPHYRKLAFAFGMASVALVIALFRYLAA